MSDPTSVKFGDVRERIEDRLGYGDSLGSWVREACRMRLEMENPDDPEVATTDEDA